MNIKEIKEMLSNPDVRQVVEEQINKQVEEKKAQLETERVKLQESKKTAEKELFLLRKTVMAKSTIYENKLKEYYESKFTAAKKKLGKEVYDFINESVKSLTKTIEAEAKTTNETAKLQEAFGTAVRAMAPFMNINELVDTNKSKIDGLTTKLNHTTKQLKVMESKVLTADLHSMVVAECAGYPMGHVALLYETVVKMEPKSLTEGKSALAAAKVALKEKEIEMSIQQTKITESTTATTENTDRNKLKVIAEGIKAKKHEATTSTEDRIKTKSALDYDVYLG